MVANELTSSVQKKGTKTIVAAATAMLLSGVSVAQDGWVNDQKLYNSDGNFIGVATNYVTGAFDNPGSLMLDKTWESGASVPGNFWLLYLNGASASLTQTDAKLGLTTATPQDCGTQLQSMAVTVANGATLNLNGTSADISVQTDADGKNHSQVTALDVNGGTANLSAATTNISATSTRKNGKAVYAVAAGNGTINLTGGVVNITVKTATDRDVTANNVNHRGEAMAIDAWKNGSVVSSTSTHVNIDVAGTGVGAVDTSGEYPLGASNVYGLVAEGGKIDLKGTSTIKASSVAGTVKGVRITNGAYTMTGGTHSGDGAVTLGGDATVTVSSSAGDAYGIDASEFTSVEASTTISGNVAFTSKGKLDVNVTTSADKSAVGIAVNEQAVVNLNGVTTVTAKTALAGNGTINVGNALTLNGSLADFNGKLNLNNGAVFELTADHGTVGDNVIQLAGGTLQGGESVLFTNAGNLIDADASAVSIETKGALNSAIASGTGTLAVTDSGWYTTASLEAMGDIAAAKGLLVSLTNAQLHKNAGESATLVDGVVQAQETAEYAPTTVDSEGSVAVSLSGDTGAAGLVIKDIAGSTTPVTSVDLSTTTEGDAKNFVLVGSSEGGDLVTNETGAALNVSVGKDVTLLLGSTAEGVAQTKGELAAVSLKEGAAMAVANIVAKTQELITEANAKVNVGNATARGALEVGKLNLVSGATVFVDPAWQGNQELDVVANASHFAVTDVAGSTFAGTIGVGQNSVVSLGADAQTAISGFERLAQTQGLAWGPSGVQAALYIGAPVTVTGSVIVDGTMTQAPAQSTGGVIVNNGALLMVDQAGVGTKAVTGTVTLGEGSTLGLVNASSGSFTLADTVNDNGATVVTDNPFVSASLDNGQITSSVDAEGGLTAIASTGIQAMTQRADFTLSQTIADRASMDQELGTGLNLWVDVSGETYEADGFENGAEFKADMGYGAFGADIALTDTMTAGMALQYGTGSLRSPVSSIKNSIDNYGLSLYGTAKFGDAKLLAEASYVWAENDIQASQTALNQSVDSSVYSFGVTGMYEFRASEFSIVPSIGVRVSQLETDAMQVGSVRVDDQDQTLVQVPIALRINGADMNAGGWKLAPSFKIAYVPTFGDDEIEVFDAKFDVIDTSPVQADIGLRACNGNWLMNAGFSVGAGKNGTSSVGGKIGVKYAF